MTTAQAQSQPEQRVSRIGTPLRKPAGGPPHLTKRHVALIEFMVHGLPCAFPRHPEIEPHVPLDVNQAADCAGVRRKSARDLLKWPIFVTRYESELAARRKGEHARSIDRMIKLRDDAGAGKAADRKVQLQAAKDILGEHERGTTVNVGVQVNNQQTAGVVIRLPWKQAADTPTIEHEDRNP